MPLPAYGVLIGTLNRFTREDPNNYGSWYHGKLYVDAPAGQYECAVDVSTPAGIKVQYRVARRLSRLQLAPILALPLGWSPLPSTRYSGAIDYIRSALFGATPATRYFGFWLFRRESFVGRILRWLEALRNPWIDSSGDNALNALETHLLGSARVFVFGAPYTTGLGVHDIHMNQGDPAGQFQHLDGIWQDGCVLIERPTGEILTFLSKFETQSLHTNSQGLPV